MDMKVTKEDIFTKNEKEGHGCKPNNETELSSYQTMKCYEE